MLQQILQRAGTQIYWHTYFALHAHFDLLDIRGIGFNYRRRWLTRTLTIQAFRLPWSTAFYPRIGSDTNFFDRRRLWCTWGRFSLEVLGPDHF